MNRGALCALAIILVACSRGDDRRPTPAAPKGTLALGEPITSPFVTLAEIAKSPGKYEHQRVATSGKVTSVCQARGCWMEIGDASGQAHVRMHGHTFFVPRTSSGHMARVQADVLPAGSEHCEESPQTEAALVELDATGVELD